VVASLLDGSRRITGLIKGTMDLAEHSGLLRVAFSCGREPGAEDEEPFEVVSQGHQGPLQRCFGLAA